MNRKANKFSIPTQSESGLHPKINLLFDRK